MEGSDEEIARQVNRLLHEGQHLYDRMLLLSFEDIADRKAAWSRIVELQGRISRLMATSPDAT
jgi:hypothetical protein